MDISVFLNDMIGCTEFYCRCVIEDVGMTWRIVCRDGEFLIVTDDNNSNRINLTMKNGRAIAATIG